MARIKNKKKALNIVHGSKNAYNAVHR